MRGKKARRLALVLTGLLCIGSPAQAAVFHPQHFVLANGLQVVVVENRLAPAVVQMLWYKAGAADDPAGRSGLAHYLEHMMFKGTDRLPPGAFSQIVAAQGGDDNAFTTHDSTAYHVAIAADRLGLAMQMEADRMQNLRLDPGQAAAELAVVLSERQQRTDNDPQGVFDERLRAALFEEHPYGRPVIGWQSEIEKITPQDALAYYKTHYAPDNAVLVVSGDVHSSEVIALAAATFGRVPKNAISPAAPSWRSLAAPRENHIVLRDDRVRQPLWTRRIIAPSFKQNAKQADALEVLAEILGGEVGLLHRQFVMERRLADGVDVSYDPVTRGPSVFALAATPSAQTNMRALETALLKYLHALAKTGVKVADVAAAKQRLQDSAIFARDRLMAPAQILGEVLTVGGTVQAVESWPERMASVTPAQVNEALRALLKSDRSVTGLLLPAEQGEALP